jgi:hypothetical protein
MQSQIGQTKNQTSENKISTAIMIILTTSVVSDAAVFSDQPDYVAASGMRRRPPLVLATSQDL